jgi:hypothetical protein
MVPRTFVEPKDDPAFLALVDRVVAHLTQSQRPTDVHLVHIDNWFGPKWLRYSGKGVVAFPLGYASNILVALDDHYQDRLTFPPFNRNRIVAQYYFARLGDGTYEEQSPSHRVHRRRWRWKEQHVHRRVEAFSRSGLFAWYSSGTVVNGKASLMVYAVHDGVTEAWYAGFTHREVWRVDHVSGMSRESLQALLSTEPRYEL